MNTFELCFPRTPLGVADIAGFLLKPCFLEFCNFHLSNYVFFISFGGSWPSRLGLQPSSFLRYTLSPKTVTSTLSVVNPEISMSGLELKERVSSCCLLGIPARHLVGIREIFVK